MISRILAFPLLGLLIGCVGCGSSFSPVAGVVTLDGNPVDHASVTLVSEDGKTTYSGVTDASGIFTVVSGEEAGARPGTYKVLVTRTKSIAGSESMSASDPDYFKAMEKQAKEAKSNTAKMPGGAMVPPGGMMPPGMNKGSASTKSDLPPIYSSLTTTPLSLKVPVENPPAKFELKK